MIQISKKKIACSDGTLLYYETYEIDGNRPSVFFIHGVGGDLDAWQYIKDNLLESEISSMAMDLRGHGYSGHPRHPKKYSLRTMAQDMHEILRAEEIKKICVIGHSYGAVVALHFALNFPEETARLAVISGTYHPPAYLSSKALAIAGKYAAIALALMSPPPIRPGHSKYPRGKFHKEYEFFGLMRTIIRNSLGSYLLSNTEIANLSLEDQLSKITMPTLLLVGENDTIFPVSISERMHELIPGSQLRIIPGGNHVIVLNNIAETSEALCSFIKQQP